MREWHVRPVQRIKKNNKIEMGEKTFESCNTHHYEAVYVRTRQRNV